MKKLTKLGIAGLALLLAKTAKADELYLKAAYTLLNPAEYNSEIQKVSVGDVYGSALSIGAGYNKPLSDKIGLNLEVSRNSQKVDSVKEDLSGNKSVFGYNSMTLTSLDASVVYKKPIIEDKTYLELSAGPSFTHAYLETKNEAESGLSESLIVGVKLGAGVRQQIGDKIFVNGTIAYRLAGKDNLNISGLELALNIGMKLPEGVHRR